MASEMTVNKFFVPHWGLVIGTHFEITMKDVGML